MGRCSIISISTEFVQTTSINVVCDLLNSKCSKLFYFAQIPTIFFAFVCEIFIGEAEEKVAEGFHVELSNLVM